MPNFGIYGNFLPYKHKALQGWFKEFEKQLFKLIKLLQKDYFMLRINLMQLVLFKNIIKLEQYKLPVFKCLKPLFNLDKNHAIIGFDVNGYDEV